MIVTAQQIQRGVSKYIETELARKATGITKFGIYFMMPRISQNTIDYINKFQDNPLFKGMFDESGNIELDEVYNCAKQAIQKSGQVEAYGFIFKEDDIDKLYNYIKNN